MGGASCDDLSVVVDDDMNPPADIYREDSGNPLEGSLNKGTFRQVSREQREAWLEEIERRFAGPVTL